MIRPRVLLASGGRPPEVRPGEEGVGDDGAPRLAHRLAPQEGLDRLPDQDALDNLVRKLGNRFRWCARLPLPLPARLQVHGVHAVDKQRLILPGQ
jgi:hypothetical protein